MSKSPYWAMIGAVIGFFIGAILIMLFTADFSINNIVTFPGDGISHPAMQFRVIFLTICTLMGILIGFSSGMVTTHEK
jgi:hypothetical protein